MGRGTQSSTSRWFRLPDRHRLFIHCLQLSWISVVLWFELGTFNSTLSNCHWPVRLAQNRDDPSSTPRTSNILLIADPQILDSHSYPDRSPVLSRLTQFIVDLNLRKSWRLVTMKLKPHVVVFLGDMMDGGRGMMGDDEYETYYRRFRNIFKIPQYPLPTYYLPGNHDTGLGSSPFFSPNATDRYKSHFGPLNKRISIANHTVLFIDAPALVEEDRERVRYGYAFGGPDGQSGEGKGGWSAMPGGTVEFVRRFAAEKRDKPIVLFTHIPLSRPDGTDCGPLREKGTVHRGAGFGYENTLSEEASSFLLQNIRPSIIFSGDDHDYCTTTHTLPPHPSSPKTHKQHSSTETTVKSFSIAMGIKRPGFQLLSLVSTEPYQQQLHTPCILPNQLGIYIWGYAVLGVVSLVGVLIANVYRVRRRGRGKERVRSGTPTRTEEGIGLVSVKVERPGGASARRATLESGGGQHGRKLSASGNGVENLSLDEREGEGFMNGIAQAQFLPAPSHHPRERAFSWTFVLANKRRRIFIPSIPSMIRRLLCCGEARTGRWDARGRDTEKDGERKGLVRGFLSDVRDVACPPVGVFLVIAWWMFR